MSMSTHRFTDVHMSMNVYHISFECIYEQEKQKCHVYTYAYLYGNIYECKVERKREHV